MNYIWSAGLSFELWRMASQTMLLVLLLGIQSKYLIKSSALTVVLFILIHIVKFTSCSKFINVTIHDCFPNIFISFI